MMLRYCVRTGKVFSSCKGIVDFQYYGESRYYFLKDAVKFCEYENKLIKGI